MATQETYDFLSQVFVSNVDQLVKEIASMIVYNYVSKLKPDEAQKIAIMFVKNFDLKWSTEKQIYT